MFHETKKHEKIGEILDDKNLKIVGYLPVILPYLIGFSDKNRAIHRKNGVETCFGKI